MFAIVDLFSLTLVVIVAQSFRKLQTKGLILTCFLLLVFLQYFQSLFLISLASALFRFPLQYLSIPSFVCLPLCIKSFTWDSSVPQHSWGLQVLSSDCLKRCLSKPETCHSCRSIFFLHEEISLSVFYLDYSLACFGFLSFSRLFTFSFSSVFFHISIFF